MRDRRVTNRLVNSLRATGTEYCAWDDMQRGFGVRVMPGGAMSFVVKYRAGSGRGAPVRRVTLGKVGTITPDQARELAKRVLGAVAGGADPASEKAAERRAETVNELVALFLSHVEAKRKPATAYLYRHLLEQRVLPELGTRKASKVTTADLARLHAKLRATPYVANRTIDVIASLYSFSARQHLLLKGFINPAKNIEKYREEGRERYLTFEELAQLGDAIREAEIIGLPWEVDEAKPTAKHAPKPMQRRTKIGSHAAAAIRLLILTGARLREILHLRWEHVDLERGLLFVADSKTGKKTIVLNAPSMAVLAGLPRVGGYVIAGQDAGTDAEKPRADLNRPWRAVVKRARLAGLRIHDLRHTHASIGAGAGLGLPIIGKLLGHTKAATTEKYAHLDVDPLRRASENIGSRIAAAMGELDPKSAQAEVVPIDREGAMKFRREAGMTSNAVLATPRRI
jgi:integrase